MNIIIKAASNHKAISAIVRLVTRGLVIKIIKVVIMPNEMPTAKLEKSTIAA